MTSLRLRHTPSLAAALATLSALAPACATAPRHVAEATAPPAPSAQAPEPGLLTDSSVDISYMIGHSHRRFVAWANGDQVGGQTLLEHQILRESPIDRGRYGEFVAKVEQFVTAPRRRPAEQGAAPAAAGVAAPAGVAGAPAAAAPAPAGTPGAAPAAEEGCRTPFTVNVRVGTDTRIIQGCRGADEGALSHLVRDGEFLLYSN